jgi:hypothetical protein
MHSGEGRREYLDKREEDPDPCAGLEEKEYWACIVEQQIG